MKNHYKKLINLLVLFLFASISLLGQSSILKKRESYQTLSQIGKLEPEMRKETFLLTTYKPVYVLPFRFSSHRSEVPFEVPVEEASFDKPIELDNVEATLQLSFKTKIAQNIFGKGDL